MNASGEVMEELAGRALTEFDLEARFRARAARGGTGGARAAALALLDRLDGEDRANGADGRNA